MTTGRVKALFEYKIPDEPQINYSYQELCHYSHRHGVFYNADEEKIMDAYQKKLEKFSSSLTYKVAELESFLEHPKNYLSIKHINSKIGYCLTANQGIPKDIVIGTYSGDILFKSKDSLVPPAAECAYNMSMCDLSATTVTCGGFVYTVTLSAYKSGDFTRFSCHAPQQLDAFYPLSRNIMPDDVLMRNVTFEPALIRDKNKFVPIMYYKTLSTVYQNNLLCISYGDNYWYRIGKPALFLKNKLNPNLLRLSYFNKANNIYENPTESFELARKLPIILKRKRI